ncbi:hypothetical protein FOMPIDRAFT_1137474 [Fomitopsis schrenkii]|uniref:Uncharacterized protein n=1 Tax=Fomitopsis schrenkii TaxID=2126942 RepID=S8DMV7_FOMSC|nr:hypothetical protein FOMPIDRAFT_1137474 [Fomitopsis schrenkii]
MKTRRGGKKHAGHNSQPRPPHAAFTYEPPPVDILGNTPNWESALKSVSPLCHPPPRAALYYFPPPFSFITAGDKTGRFIHNYARICMFCKQRVFEPHFDGRPLRISEWRHALHGDYGLDEPDGPTPPSGSSVADVHARLRHEQKQAFRKLFARSAGLVSYSKDMLPKFRRDRITATAAASGRGLARQVIWEVNEMNWRCELRALDALLVDVGQIG